MLTEEKRIEKIDRFNDRLTDIKINKIPRELRTIKEVLDKLEEERLLHIAKLTRNKIHGLADIDPEVNMHNITLKPVGTQCNLSCDYCYYDGVRRFASKRYAYSNRKISDRLLKRIMHQVGCYFKGEVRFIWYGGEPLLGGIDFYKKAIDYQRQYCANNLSIENYVQTNATLLNEKWIKFFKENNFSLGFSMDISEETHNLHRKYPSSRGSYRDILNAIKLLKKNGLKFGVIVTVSPYYKKSPKVLIKRFIQQGISSSVNIRPCFHQDIILSPKAYADYIIELFEEWLILGSSKIRFNIFDDIFRGFKGLYPTYCTKNGTCGNHLAIEPNGDVWLCDRPFINDDYRFGNIMKNNFKQILNGKKYQRFLKLKNRILKNCQSSCKWFFLCNSGCSYLRSLKTNTIGPKEYYCGAYRKIYDYVVNRLDQIIDYRASK